MECSSKYLCINPNQGNLSEKDFYKNKKQCKLCNNKKISPPPFDYKFCQDKDCTNPNQGNLIKEDFAVGRLICKLCANRYSAKHREEHKEYYENYKNSGRKFETHLMRTYNINLEQYNKLIKNQNYKCLICKNKFNNNEHVDHDHKTGKVRGILCDNCNLGLGKFKDNITLLTNAIKYLNQNV